MAFSSLTGQAIPRSKSFQRIVVLASHSLQTLAQMSNIIVWLEKGKIRDMGAPDDVLAAYVRSLSHPEKVEAAIL